MGLLLERPGYGYELTRRLTQRLGPTWQLPESAVYGVLDNLKTKKLVRTETREVPRPRARERVMYYPTDEARAWFDDWIRTPSRKEPVRTELVAKLAVAQPEHLADLRSALHGYEGECLAMLTEAADFTAPRQDSFHELLGCIMEDAAVDHLDAEIQWARRARRRVDEYLEKDADRQ